MSKKILTVSALILTLATAGTAFAQTATTTPSAKTSAAIVCVGTAVAARESSLDSAMTTYTQAMNGAYGARATALQQAYGLTTLKEVKVAVKTAWSAFNASMKSARKTWQTARNAAWSTYRIAAVACKAPVGTGDGVNSVSEAAGN